MTIKQYILFIFITFPAVSDAQRTIQHTNLLWGGYYNTIVFNKNWSLVSDVQLRTKDWTDEWSQILVRSGMSYKFNDHLRIAVGFAFFKNAQYLNKQLLLKNEWRPWQELSYETNLNKLNFTQKLRTEQRFLQEVININLTNKYEYIFRLRYRFDWQFPLKKNNIRLLLGNEVLVNPAYINNTRFFDQNRTFTGLNFRMKSNTSLQIQYLKLFQWHSNTYVLEDQNVFRINIYQQFNFKKSHESK
ncbi:MAG: DUF2490 domain-containing protein [Ginsengibacter sp.]